jgi:excisionase family DNA binding protein
MWLNLSTTARWEMVKVDWDKVAHSNERVLQLAYTVKDAARMTGMSRTRLYEELKSGRLVAKKVGRSTLIPHESIEAWLKNLETYPASKQNQNTLKNDLK